MKRNIKLISGLFSLLILFASCSLEPEIADELEFNPSTLDESTIRNLMDGSYEEMMHHRYYGRNYMLVAEVRTDNVFANGNTSRFRRTGSMQIPPTNGRQNNIFKHGYYSLSGPNSIINSDENEIEALSEPEDKENIKHIIGEAYLARALVHFDLLRMYGQAYLDEGDNLGVSYVKEFKGEELNIPRGTIDENKKDIYDDINTAISYFKEGNSSSYASSKTKLTLSAAYGLISRVGVYFKDYDQVLSFGDEIENLIATHPVTPEEDVVDYWAPNAEPGPASVFEIAVTPSESQGIDGLAYSFRNGKSGVYGDIQVFENLLDDAEFDANDIRASKAMIDYEGSKLRNMGKYPSDGTDLGVENIKVMRIAEVVLNYAEALSEKGQTAKALEYLNSIPSNRGLGDNYYTTPSIENLLKERRKELLFEGFRFFDLVRFRLGIRDMDPNTPNNHGVVPAGDSRLALPIPQEEIDSNHESVQNPGYN